LLIYKNLLLQPNNQQHKLREDFYAELFPLGFQAKNPELNLIALCVGVHLDTLFHKHIPHTDVFHTLLDLQANYYAVDRNDAYFGKS